jgi:hypothetical protein
VLRVHRDPDMAVVLGALPLGRLKRALGRGAGR